MRPIRNSIQEVITVNQICSSDFPAHRCTLFLCCLGCDHRNTSMNNKDLQVGQFTTDFPAPFKIPKDKILAKVHQEYLHFLICNILSETTWGLFWDRLGTVWRLFGYRLGTAWGPFGDDQGTYRGHIGDLQGTTWGLLGDHLGTMSGVSSGACFPDFGLHSFELFVGQLAWGWGWS